MGVGNLSANRNISSGHERVTEGVAFLAIRFNSFLGEGESGRRSSLELEGVAGGVDGRYRFSLMVTRRRRDTHIDASEAISCAKLEDRGDVLNTTKYEMFWGRGKIKGLGRVI